MFEITLHNLAAKTEADRVARAAYRPGLDVTKIYLSIGPDKISGCLPVRNGVRFGGVLDLLGKTLTTLFALEVIERGGDGVSVLAEKYCRLRFAELAEAGLPFQFREAGDLAYMGGSLATADWYETEPAVGLAYWYGQYFDPK